MLGSRLIQHLKKKLFTFSNLNIYENVQLIRYVYRSHTFYVSACNVTTVTEMCLKLVRIALKRKLEKKQFVFVVSCSIWHISSGSPLKAVRTRPRGWLLGL